MSLYEEIDYKKLEELETKHNWIAEPIYKAPTYVKNMPFYDWIENINNVQDFKDAGCQLYYHSDTLEGIELWASMIHSWIGISTYPKFNLKGEIIKDIKC
ncbi:MAG: hypothetical protein LGB78_06145 [Sulfurovum sp.]|nr:hypothetical protein [Sulfurovum sp.]